MDEEIERLCGKMKLTEGEQNGIAITEGDVTEAKEQGENCIVGKVWAEKPVNKEAFRTMLSRIWRLVGRVVFKEIGDNLWLFEFSNGDDKRRVMEGRPWSYDRQALVLNDFDGKTTPSHMKFNHTPIWVQVHDMPLLCMTRGVGEKIGASMGELVEVDIAGDGAGWGRSLRLRVVIDLSQPLERGRALKLGGKSYWVSFRYENLPLFCFHCGRVVHGQQGCPRRQFQRRNQEESKEWGIWLRADQKRKDRSRRTAGGVGGTMLGPMNSQMTAVTLARLIRERKHPGLGETLKKGVITQPIAGTKLMHRKGKRESIRARIMQRRVWRCMLTRGYAIRGIQQMSGPNLQGWK
jgi:hypothetical protein